MGLSKLVSFDGAVAILVCKSERDLGRVSAIRRGAEWGLVYPKPDDPQSKLVAVARTVLNSSFVMLIRAGACG